MPHLTLTGHWKFQRLARAVGSKVLARGILETLWESCWAAGDPYCGTSEDIEALCDWKGERGALTEALLMPGAKSAGFIEPYSGRLRGQTDRHYQAHDFFDHYLAGRRKRQAGVPKLCLSCGDEYLARSPKSRVCSPRCRQQAYRDRQGKVQEKGAGA